MRLTKYLCVDLMQQHHTCRGTSRCASMSDGSSWTVSLCWFEHPNKGSRNDRVEEEQSKHTVEICMPLPRVYYSLDS